MIIQPITKGLAVSRVQLIFQETFAIRNVEILIANTDETCNDEEVDSLQFDNICKVALDLNETCSHDVQIINSICLGDGGIHASFVKLVIEPFVQEGPSDQIGIASLVLLTKRKVYKSPSSVDKAPLLTLDVSSGDKKHPAPLGNNFQERFCALEELKRDRAQNEVRKWGAIITKHVFYVLMLS